MDIVLFQAFTEPRNVACLLCAPSSFCDIHVRGLQLNVSRPFMIFTLGFRLPTALYHVCNVLIIKMCVYFK